MLYEVITVSLGATEGPMRLWVRSADRLGNVGLDSVNFYYDVAPPSLNELSVGTTDTQYRNADLVFGGTASDSNYLNPATGLTVSVNGAAAENIAT